MDLKGFLKNNFLIVLVYLLLIGTSVGFLLNYGKVQIHDYLNQFVGNSFFNYFFYYITYLGDGAIAAFILLFILLYNIRLGLYASASFLTATLLSITLKHQIYDDVNRPSFVFKYYLWKKLNVVEGTHLFIHNSFPSGHSTQAFSIFMCLIFATKNQAYKFLFLGLAVFTAISRVYLSQHWLVDITVGSIIGTLFSLVYYFIFIHGNRIEKLNRPLLNLKKS
ncbi:phospholipid phosphatase [Sphingobacteriaceae bacterium]|nr:phospholipid phosphatase [Sphingobacteriaceae bacterium]